MIKEELDSMMAQANIYYDEEDKSNKDIPFPLNYAQEAKRDPIDFLYTSLEADFLDAMAKIGAHAERKFKETGGANNYKNSRLGGDKGPINHIYQHLSQYRQGQEYDHLDVGRNACYHLAAIAYNAMMEWYYYNNLDYIEINPELTQEPPPQNWEGLGLGPIVEGNTLSGVFTTTGPSSKYIEEVTLGPSSNYVEEVTLPGPGPLEKLASMFGWKPKDN